jgi:hypothetical protein
VKPDPAQSLIAAAMKLGELAAGESEAQRQADLGYAAMLAVQIAQDLDRGAVRRIEECDVLVGLIERGVELAPPALAASLRAALDEAGTAGDTPESLRLSALDARLDTLRRAFVELQAHLEDKAHGERPSDQARSLLDDCWKEHRAGIARRQVALNR